MSLLGEQVHIVAMIRSSPDQRQEATRLLANDRMLKSDINHYVRSHQGSDDDGLMVFHDSIISFVKKVFTDHDFVLETTYAGYIFGIAKYLWSNMLKKKSRLPSTIPVSNKWNIISSSDQFVELNKEELSTMIQDVLSFLKPKCKEILMYWATGYTMKEIASLTDYASEGMVRKKKCQCYRELSEWLDNHPEFKNKLNNLL